VILIDGAKAALACLLGGLLLQPYDMRLEGMTIGGLSVMVGHIFPMLLVFKGGKGILSGCIIAFVVDWRIGAIALALFAILYLTTQYVSLGSVFGTIALCAGFAVFHHDNLVVMICGIAMGGLALFMHRKNIRRLIKGEESKTNLFRKGKKQ
jgi:glycerol-3-phosphate acyltransferase PlsY